MRPSGIFDARTGRISKPPHDCGCTMAVSIGPGWMEFTRMPERPSSSAAVLVNPRMPNFAVTYPAMPGAPTTPFTDDTFTIDPPPARIISGAAYLIPVYIETRL